MSTTHELIQSALEGVEASQAASTLPDQTATLAAAQVVATLAVASAISDLATSGQMTLAQFNEKLRR